MTDQAQRLEIATVRAEIGSNITYRFNNDAIDAGGIPTESGDIPNLKQVILQLQEDGAEKISFATTIYPTTAAGIAATTDGAVFLVVSNQADEIYAVYTNTAGVAVDTGKRALSSQAVQDAMQAATEAAEAAQDAADLSTQRTARFLAPISTPPTLRDDGTPLQIGDRYVNTVDQAEYIYKTGGWALNDSLVAVSELEIEVSETQDRIDIIEGPDGGDSVGFTAPGSGAVAQSVSGALRSMSVNVMHFGAAGIGGDDTVAVQAALAYAVSSGRALYFPSGSYAISQALLAENKSLTVFGDGIGLSKIYIDHNGIGFKYTSTSAANNLTIKGVEIISADPDAISGLDIQFPGAVTLDQSQLTLEDVTVRAEGSSTWSYACIRLDGIMNPFLNRVVVRGTVAKTLYGVALEDQVVDATLDGVRAFLVGTGIFIGTACEGISIDNYTAVTVKRGVDANPLNNGPWVNITNFHINSSEYGIRLYNRSQSVITNGLLYANNLLGATEWKGISIETGANSSAGSHFNISNVIFNHQVFSGNTIGVNCIKAVYGVIHGCQFVNVIQPIVEDSKTNVVIKINNQYPGVTNPVISNGLSAGEPFRIVPILAQNRLYVQGGAVGATPLIGVEGVDTVSGLSIAAKGAGANISFSSSGAGTGLTVNVPASSVNRVRVAGGAAGAAVKVDVIGTDTNVWLSIQGKGTGGVILAGVAAKNYASDADAATAGVPVEGVYHTSGALKIRIS